MRILEDGSYSIGPGCVIDIDNWPMPDKKTWLNYVRIQPQLGVPSLYYLWHMDNSDEKINDEDLQVVKDCWAEYEKKQNRCIISDRGELD